MGDQTSEIEDLERIIADTRAAPIKISYSVIKYITKNFAQVIGEGGFGVVYLGGLQNGMVAVKKLFTSKDFSDKQFLDEVTCLRKVNHRNIVRFLGYCADSQGEVMEIEGRLRIVEVQQRLLCFEYAPNGNLHHYLKEKTHGYEWNVHYQIIKGICQGLHYIHQEHINHLDLKPANVLLGANWVPKITDFGVSRCIEEQSTMVTENIFGTMGYIAPEFIDRQQISFKSDIFSLGVIMINILTGCNGCVIENWHEAIDVHCPQMKRCIEIAQTCVNGDPHNRPTSGEIIHSLNETEAIIQKDHVTQKYKPIINELRNDIRSSLYQVVRKFQVLPAETSQKPSRKETLYMELEVPECLLEGSQKPGNVSYHLLQFITGKFSYQQEIGRGGFAVTYKGILRQRSVAVKRLSMTQDLDDRMFHKEIETMMLVRHKNIVQFLGYCSYTQQEALESHQGDIVMADLREKLLCFEYLGNGSLDRYVSDASCGLEWRERYCIIKGICEGLHYLHTNHILHLDLRPANILLNDNMVPKIADFGLSKCFDENQSTGITLPVGSLGYMAPERYGGLITFKSDIYSLGIIILEILTGCKGYQENVLESWRTRLGTSSTDILLEQVRVCSEISIACTESDPAKRPDMQRIIDMLGETERKG